MTGDILTALIAVVIIVICVFSIKSYVRKIGSGCCGGSEKRIRVRDKNTAHYPHHIICDTEGMHCSQCARRIENAFNALSGVYAKANYKNGQVEIRTKEELSDTKINSVISSLGYTVNHLKHVA